MYKFKFLAVMVLAAIVGLATGCNKEKEDTKKEDPKETFQKNIIGLWVASEGEDVYAFEFEKDGYFSLEVDELELEHVKSWEVTGTNSFKLSYKETDEDLGTVEIAMTFTNVVFDKDGDFEADVNFKISIAGVDVIVNDKLAFGKLKE